MSGKGNVELLGKREDGDGEDEAISAEAFALYSTDARIIPSVFQGVEADQLDAAGQVLAARLQRNWTDRYPAVKKGLLLQGVVGCGKSLQAALVLRGLLRKGHTRLRFLSVKQFLAQFVELRRERRSEQDYLHELVRRTQVVVLDDLGVEDAGASWELQRLYRLVSDPYDAGGKPIVTTNYTPSELAARFGSDLGGRFVSRLRGIAELVTDFPEVDYRLR